MRIPALFLALAVSACSRAPARTEPAPARATPTAAVETRTLEAKRIPEAKGQGAYEFSHGGRRFRIGHGVWKIPEDSPGWNSMYGWGPVVWVTEKGRTRVLDLREKFPSHYVSHVFRDFSGTRIFLFLDYGIEGPNASYVVWSTSDAGEHWRRSADLPRPPGEFPPSSLVSFRLDAAGHGEADLRLEAGNLYQVKRPSIPAGSDVFFRVTTDDGGLTWHAEEKPAFESVIQAEPEIRP